jgi:hypothetical protein
VIVTGLGYTVRIDRLMRLGIGLLFVVIGNYLTRVEPNWFVGIRTPWTLSSDKVWRKTHRTGGWLMVIGGLAFALGAFLPPGALLPLLIATIVVVAVFPIVQSYVLWKREQPKPYGVGAQHAALLPDRAQQDAFQVARFRHVQQFRMVPGSAGRGQKLDAPARVPRGVDEHRGEQVAAHVI